VEDKWTDSSEPLNKWKWIYSPQNTEWQKKVSSIMVSCVNKNQLACFIAHSGLCSSNCKNKHTRKEIIRHPSYQMYW
jgi:hypothetical protein